MARSSTESEYRAWASAASELQLTHQLLLELGIRLQTSPPLLWCDNMGAQALSSNPVHHARTKHVEIDVHFVRDLVSSHKLEVRYVPTSDQPADLFTKPLSADRLHFLAQKLCLGPSFSLRGHIEKIPATTCAHTTLEQQ